MTCRENFKNAGISKSERAEERPNLGPFSRWPIRKRKQDAPHSGNGKGQPKGERAQPKETKAHGDRPKTERRLSGRLSHLSSLHGSHQMAGKIHPLGSQGI